jgi:hypothetical protein
MSELKEVFEQVHESLNRIEKIIAEKAENKGNGRFIDNGDNTVMDTKTGLVWVKDHDVIVDKKFAKRMTWKDAVEACKSLDYSGHKDWRLPTREELCSIVDLTRSEPAIDPIFKAHTDDWYWTSTTCAWYAGSAWCVDFNDGSVDDFFKGSNGYVRPVRVSQ